MNRLAERFTDRVTDRTANRFAKRFLDGITNRFLERFANRFTEQFEKRCSCMRDRCLGKTERRTLKKSPQKCWVSSRFQKGFLSHLAFQNAKGGGRHCAAVDARLCGGDRHLRRGDVTSDVYVRNNLILKMQKLYGFGPPYYCLCPW